VNRFISFRSVVDPSDCDFLGHMNVSRYFAACSDGVFAIQTEMGLSAKDMRDGRQLSFAVVHAESDFKSELIAGDSIYLETQVMNIGSKSMTFHHRLIRAEDRSVAFETVFKCVLLSLKDRKAVSIPEDVRQHASQLLSSNQSD
jgi:acyl-CoA thioester hydrolase